MTPITKEKTNLKVGDLLLFGRELLGELGLILGWACVLIPFLVLLLRRFCVFGVEPPGADGQELCTCGTRDSSPSKVLDGQRTRA
jgi:hypothetical protein